MAQITRIPHQLTQNVKLLHKAAIVVGGKVLILKRSADAKSRPQKWDLPGGNSEWPAQANDFAKNLHQADIAREIQEETGLLVDPQIFTVENLVYFATYFNPAKQLYSVNCGWQVLDIIKPPLESVKLSSEHTQFQWIRLNKLDNYDFGPKDRDFEMETIRRALTR
jgi:8-oxo-dGTP pyrophosphatase MutT (NUDIX family)